MPKATNYSALSVGKKLGGSDITFIKKGTFTLDPASIASAGQAVQSVTVTGAAVGDQVALIAPADLEALIVGQAYVSAANTVKFALANNSGGAIDGASKTWSYVLTRYQ